VERDALLRDALERALSEVSAGVDPLDLVADIPVVEAFADEVGQRRIDQARAAGASWADIARRLGVSRQAAHKRFQGKDDGRRIRLELKLERGKPRRT
jgi:hypothetical protein